MNKITELIQTILMFIVVTIVTTIISKHGGFNGFDISTIIVYVLVMYLSYKMIIQMKDNYYAMNVNKKLDWFNRKPILIQFLFILYLSMIPTIFQ